MIDWSFWKIPSVKLRVELQKGSVRSIRHDSVSLHWAWKACKEIQVASRLWDYTCIEYHKINFESFLISALTTRKFPWLKMRFYLHNMVFFKIFTQNQRRNSNINNDIVRNRINLRSGNGPMGISTRCRPHLNGQLC